MMAYFKAMGKFMDEYGLTNMMVENKMLPSGSVNGFIRKKHFNRCKRLHSTASLVLQIFHVKHFDKTF